jgi:hypothetical protein
LLEGVIIRPLQHAGSYSYAVDWRPGALPLALISLVVLAAFRSWRQSGRASAAQGLLVGLRLLLLTGVLAVVALLETHRVIGVLFSYALPWLWVWVVPLREPAGETARPDARPLLACVLLLQALHGYPVGGSQLIWGSFLLFPLVALALPETGAWLAMRGPSLRRVAGLTAILPVAVVAAKAGWATRGWHDAYEQRVVLALPGTEGLRLGEREVLAYQTLVLNSVLHADRLFSLPGMFSFNLWSGVATPTLRNTTLWYALLTEAEQREIIAALEQSRRPALLVDAALIGILHHSGAPPTGPLYTYLLANFHPAFAFHGLGFWVRQGRLLLPAGTAWRLPDNGHGYHIALSGLDTPVERIELRDADRPDAGRLIMDARNSHVAIQPVNLDGTPRSAAVEAVWPLRIDGPVWVTIRSSDLATFVPGAASVLEFKSADGRRMTAALVVDAK